MPSRIALLFSFHPLDLHALGPSLWLGRSSRLTSTCMSSCTMQVVIPITFQRRAYASAQIVPLHSLSMGASGSSDRRVSHCGAEDNASVTSVTGRGSSLSLPPSLPLSPSLPLIFLSFSLTHACMHTYTLSFTLLSTTLGHRGARATYHPTNSHSGSLLHASVPNPQNDK